MRAGSIALVAVLTVSLAAPSASEAKRPRPPKNTTTVVDVRAVHDRVCPTVVEYLSCASLTVTVGDMGATGYYATSKPSTGEVVYNTYYQQTEAGWARTVSHEVGGHHDAWAEVKARGVDPWTDYYDLDRYAEPWMEQRYQATFGTFRDLTSGQAKELYLDCAGPVAHGYTGNYVGSLGVTDQPAFCAGSEVIMDQAVQ